MNYKVRTRIVIEKDYLLNAKTSYRAIQAAKSKTVADFGVPGDVVDAYILASCCTEAFLEPNISDVCCVGDNKDD